MKKKKTKRKGPQRFKLCEAVVWEPAWWDLPSSKRYHGKYPLKKGEVVYWLGEIPNVSGHCIVVKWAGQAVCMVHPEDFRKAKEEEL